MIQRTHRGVAPFPTITAPCGPVDRWIDHHDESIRLATFRQSELTRDGQLAPFQASRNPPASTPLAVLPDGGGRVPLIDADLETYEGICGLPLDIDVPDPLCEETK